MIDVHALSSANIRTVSKDKLTDAGSLCLDTGIPNRLRPTKLLHDTGNPYCFRVGELAVKLEFVEGSPCLQDVFCDFLQRKKSGL